MIRKKDVTIIRNQIDRRLARAYPRDATLLSRAIHYVLSPPGKRLRPLLAVFVGRACGGQDAALYEAATAIELVHNFTLVHDDIMDAQKMRRGRKPVYLQWDVATAILTGDALFALSLKSLAGTEQSANILGAFASKLIGICQGQALDKEHETRSNIPLRDYYRMIDLKTGQLFSLAAEVAAAISLRDASVCAAFGKFGKVLGRAYQISDDYREFYSDEETEGKSLRSDQALRKKSYMILHGLAGNRKAFRQAMELADKDYSAGLTRMRHILTDSGVADRAQKEIRQTVDEALDGISHLSVAQADLAEFVRNYLVPVA